MHVSGDFTPLFEPRTIAVVGASAASVAPGNRFIRHLKAFGYEGSICPIHPDAAQVEGLPAFRSVREIEQPVDYAYVAVAAAQVPAVIERFAGRVRFAQVISSGFSETADGAVLARELLAAARAAGVRVIGPNCLGLHSPRGRVTFTERVSAEPGSVGVICQSGGLGIDIARRGQTRGLTLSGLVTVGNCTDVKPSELLEHFLACEHTRAIGLYLEGVGDGRRLFEVLRAARARKPVVILKGGRTDQGHRAAASHTGALASGMAAWHALARQTGAALVSHVDEFIDSLVACQCLVRPAHEHGPPLRRVVLFGNGGGTSVLGTDALVEAGLDVPALPAPLVEALEALRLPAGSSVDNPIDVPASALQKDGGRAADRIFDVLQSGEAADLLLTHINMTAVLAYRDVDLLGNLMDAALRVRARSVDAGMRFALVLRSDGDAEAEARKQACRARAVAEGIPVFDELVPAAQALAALGRIEAFRARAGATQEG